jgi:hypothetical protein
MLMSHSTDVGCTSEDVSGAHPLWCALPKRTNARSQNMTKLITMTIALALATSAAVAGSETSTGPFWISALKVSCGQQNGIWWQGMNGAGHFIPHSPDDALSNGALHADSDIGISSLFWIKRSGDGKPGG